MLPSFNAVVPCAVLCVAGLLFGQATSTKSSPPDRFSRGRYLVDHVAKCGDCHTPRDDKGQPITTKYLQGGDLGVQPIVPNSIFARTVPDISAKGLTGWSILDLTKALQTGKRPNGEMFRPPMPAYTMSRGDAEAIAAYLKSLK